MEWDEPLFHDNSKDAPTVTQSHTFGTFPFGQTEVVYTATDGSGNSVSCNITIKLNSNYISFLLTFTYLSIGKNIPVRLPTIQLTDTRTALRTRTQFIAPWPARTDTHSLSDPPGTLLVRCQAGRSGQPSQTVPSPHSPPSSQSPPT